MSHGNDCQGNEPRNFFTSVTQCDRLRLEVAGWIGTPFFESCGGTAAKGVRADCTWVAAPLQRLGAIGAVPWPKRYVSRGGGVAMLELLCDVLDRVERLKRIWDRRSPFDIPEAIAGDVVVMSSGKALHHLLLVIGQNQVAHSWQGEIKLGSVADHQARLWYALYRPMCSGTARPACVPEL